LQVFCPPGFPVGSVIYSAKDGKVPCGSAYCPNRISKSHPRGSVISPHKIGNRYTMPYRAYFPPKWRFHATSVARAAASHGTPTAVEGIAFAHRVGIFSRGVGIHGIGLSGPRGTRPNPSSLFPAGSVIRRAVKTLTPQGRYSGWAREVSIARLLACICASVALLLAPSAWSMSSRVPIPALSALDRSCSTRSILAREVGILLCLASGRGGRY
jgi:hypothetical protein